MPYKNLVEGMGYLQYNLVVHFQTNLASVEDKDMLDHGSVGDQDNHLNCIYAEIPILNVIQQSFFRK